MIGNINLALLRRFAPRLLISIAVVVLGACGGPDTDHSQGRASDSGFAGQPFVKADPAAAQEGQWSSVAQWPFIPIHAAILPDGRVLTYGTTPDNQQGGHFEYDIWDPALGLDEQAHLTLPNSTSVDTFCSAGLVMPQSGNLLTVSGDLRGRLPGTDPVDSNRNRDVLSFDYRSDTVRRLERSINHQRWYGTMTMMPTGEVLMQGGTCWNGSEQVCDGGVIEAITPEIYRPGSGWELLNGASSDLLFGRTNDAWWYPRSWVAPDGRVFGISHGKVMYYLDTAGSGSINTVGDLGWENYGYTGSAVMYRPGKIMLAGGLNAASSDPKGSTAVRLIDINGESPQVSDGGALPSGLQWPTATVLADGQVLLTGGSERHNQLTNVQYAALLWDPDTDTWQAGAAAATPRLYHSSTLLLPDGRVFTGGGGAPGPLVNNNAEVYSPPYLFDVAGNLAVRPEIVDAPQQASWGDSNMNVVLGADTQVSRVTLVASGADTHSFDMNQRFIELSFNQPGPNTVTVETPADANLAPPGYYMLFVFDADGVPSKAAMVRITDGTESASADQESGGNLVSNGSFEQNDAAVGERKPGRLNGWFSASGEIDVWHGADGLSAASGSSWIQVDGQAGVTDLLHQQVTTLPARQYRLELSYSAPPGASSATTAVDVLWNDDIVAALTPNGSAENENNWQTVSVLVDGTGFDRLTLREIGSDDGMGAFVDSVTLVQVSPGSNQAPVMTVPDDQQALTGEQVALQLTVNDADGPVLNMLARGLPIGLNLSDSGLISGIPTQPGQYIVTVSASDGELSDVVRFEWLVEGDPTGGSAAECNLLTDGSFASGLGSWSTNTAVTEGIAGFDDSDAIQFTNGWVAHASSDVQGGSEYQISGWYQLTGSGWTGFGLNYFNAGGTKIGSIEGNLANASTWTQFQITDTVPADTAEIRLWIFAGAGMTLTLDTVILRDTACTGGGDTGGGGGSNVAPVLVNPGERTSVQGEVTSLFLNGRDDNGDPLTYSAVGLPPGLSISSAGVVTGTPQQAGTFSVTATVSDGELQASALFDWIVTGDGSGTNAAPVLNNPGAQFNDVGEDINFSLTASDADGDALTFAASGLPDGLTIDDAGGISGAPSQAGVFDVLASVSDAQQTVETSFQWTIVADDVGGNDLACNLLENGTFESGYDGWTSSAFVTLVNDAHDGVQAIRFGDGSVGTGTLNPEAGSEHTVTGWYKLAGSGWAGYGIDFFNASGLKIDEASHTLPNTSGYQQFTTTVTAPAETVEIRLWLFAGNGLTLTLDNVDLRVSSCAGSGGGDPNNAPVLSLPAAQVVTEGEVVELQLVASDVDADPLTFSVTGLPDGLSVNSNGLISGTAQQTGSWTSTVTVSDGTDDVSGALEWTVQTDNTSENQPPVLSDPGAQTGMVGETLSLAFVAEDPDNDPLVFSATGMPDGLAISTAGVVTGTPGQAGTFTSSITVSDGELNNSITVSWVIADDDSGNNGGGGECNLFDNAGFENGLEGWASNVTPQFVSDAYAGSAAANFTNGFVGNGTFNVQAGANYTIRGWYQLTGSGWTGYGLDFFNSAGTKINEASFSLSNSTGYQQFAETVQAPSGTVEIRFWIFAGSGMTLTLDEVSLTAADCNTGGGGGSTNSAPQLTSPGDQRNAPGDNVQLSLQASDADGDALDFSANGLPTGLVISAAGEISGTIEAPGSYPVTLSVSDGQAADSLSFVWVVSATDDGSGDGGSSCNLFENGSFESGTTGWNLNASPELVTDAHAGEMAARFSDGWLGNGSFDVIGGAAYTVSGWYRLTGSDWSGYGLDYFNSSGFKISADSWSLNNSSAYSEFSHTVTLPADTVEVRLWIFAGAGHVLTLDAVSLQANSCSN